MKVLKYIINVVLILIIAICGYKVYEKSREYKKADISYEQIRVKKEEENLYDKYEDYRGWIKIKNTNINYPIVQGQDNSFYLHKDIDKNYLISGSIFMNYLNNGFNDENTVLFGHHMRNGTMFAQLKKYKEKDFFYGNNDIDIELENGKTLRYRVFSAYVTDAKDNYIKTNFDNKVQYKDFLEKIKNRV